MELNQDTALTILGGGGFGWWLLTKLRKVVQHDESDISTYQVMKETVQQLSEENQRLHKTVAELQQEVAKLHVVIVELTSKLTTYPLSIENQKSIYDLVRQGTDIV